MTKLEDYAERFTGLRFRREDGVLEMTLHTDGGEALWGIGLDGLHNEIGQACAMIAGDPDNHVVILTGTGANFLVSMDNRGERPDVRTPTGWDRIYREGTALLNNLLAIPVPVIAAVNGPALIHAEIPLLSDIVLASETALFGDNAHAVDGVVPGDGVHVLWPMLLGPNRGRYALLMGERIGAQEALSLGLVGEVLAPGALLPRAWEIARTLATRSPMMLRNTRTLMTQHLKRRLHDELGYGLVLEGMALLRAG